MDSAFERSRGLGELLRDLASGGTNLLRDEIKLARMELSAIGKGIGAGTAQVALGATLLLLGTLSFLAGLILLVGDQWLPRDWYWLSALLVLLITGGLAVVLARRGLRSLAPSALAPDQTVETLKEDKEWLKQQLTSGATSN